MSGLIEANPNSPRLLSLKLGKVKVIPNIYHFTTFTTIHWVFDKTAVGGTAVGGTAVDKPVG